MEPLVLDPLNLPSTKYMDSSDDEDIVLKRSITKPKVFDSDEENSENVSALGDDKHAESDSEEKANVTLLTNKVNRKRIQRDLGSDSDESESNYLSGVNTSLPTSDKGDCVGNMKSVEKLSDPVSATAPLANLSYDSPELNRTSLFSQSDLYDAEDSEEDTHHARTMVSDEYNPASVQDPDSASKEKLKKPKERKASKKAVKENLQKIHSESQRMVRESRVSLPYHRPRQRTLAEFLSRRDHGVLPVKALKASPTKLGAVWKTLEDKVKEAEEFYKSDSDSGHDEGEQSIGHGSDQATQKEDMGENGLKNKEEIPSITSQANIGQEDGVTLLEKSSIPLEIVRKPNVEGVKFETVKMLPDNISSMKGTDCAITPGICAVNEEVSDLPCGNEIDNSNSLTASTKVPVVTSDLQKTILNEKTGVGTEENGSEVNGVSCSDNNKDVDTIPSIINNILDAVTRDESSSKSDVCQDSNSKILAPSAASSSDFSNLFPKSIMPGSDGASQIVDSSNTSSDMHGEDPSRSSVNVMDTHENSSLCQIKVPSPSFEDSESISLRLDDDTVDESGPNPDCSHIPSLLELPEDVENSAYQTHNEVSETPQISTPVKMLMELEENGEKALAEKSGADQVDDHSNAFPAATGVQLAVTTPIQLEGDLDNVIDLDEDVRANPKKEVGVRDLMARFIKHHIPKKVVCEEKKVDIGIEVVEAGGDKGPEKVKREVMTVTIGGSDPIKNASPGTERPGARLRCLREELQREIARKRDEEWAKRQQEYNLDEEEVGEGGRKCDLDNEEEEELTDSSSSEEEEEELEENDMDMSTKSRPKSAYLDDEAEESDEEGEDVDEINEEEEDVDGGNEEEDVDGGNEEEDVDGGNEEDVDGGNEEEEDIDGGKEDTIEGSSFGDIEDDQKEEEKALILENGLENKINEAKTSIDIKDTSTKDDGAGQVDSPASSKKRRFQRFKTFDLFDSEEDEANDDNSAADLTSPPSTPFVHNRNEAKGRLSLPSPALPLTALQRYNNSPSASDHTSPWAFTQKHLFDDEESPKHTKDEKNSLRGNSALLNLVGQSQGSEVAEDELLNLMSGAFLSRANKMSEAEDDFSLNLEDTQELFDKPQAKGEIKEEDESDEKRSQKSLQNFADSSWKKLSLSFNDENEDGDMEVSLDDGLEATMKRKKLKRLNISDDEDEEQISNQENSKLLEGREEDAAESDAQVSDADSEEESVEEEGESDLDEEDGMERVVEYDSEENAITVEKRAVKKTRGPRRGLEYLEAEAELSEGEEEWDGSGDEDEHGLDRMEKEEGDADKLDDELVRRELGRIHMRQVLDEDKREVRLLQEIFFEDGELHSEGQGRERKFRWRNIDNMDVGDVRPQDSDDEERVDDEDEHEEKWRRLRHERETWLRENQQNGKSQDAESLFNDVEEDSQLLKLGRAALRRINSFPNNSLMKWLKPTVEPKDKNSEATKPPDNELESPVKRPFQMLCKRGSFLARKDGTLERLAEIAIRTGGSAEPECLTSTSPVVAKTKNSRKFVFTVLSPEKKDPKTSMETPKVSLPARKSIKRKKREQKGNEGLMKKSKSCKEASIFQFL